MEEKTTTTILVSLLVLSALLIAFNQYQVSALTGMVDSASGGVSKGRISFGGGGTAEVGERVRIADVSQLGLLVEPANRDASEAETERVHSPDTGR